jgi:AmmeMemoRadiSam system protein A
MTVTAVDERRHLLRLAREALAAHVNGAASPHAALAAAAAAARRAGAFVTLRLDGELRGCIGQIEPAHALPYVVARCAVAAASEDPRFPAVRPHELELIRIEVSVLGPLQPLAPTDAAQTIVIGRHGLVVESGHHRGLLLPQVAAERGWDPAAFAAHTCVKAGLPHDAWRTGAALFCFEAEVFSEV